MSELWSKDWCPSCRAGNWSYVGDSDDCTSGVDFDGLECHACGHKWLIVDQGEIESKYGFGDDEDPLDQQGQSLEDYITYEKGKATP